MHTASAERIHADRCNADISCAHIDKCEFQLLYERRFHLAFVIIDDDGDNSVSGGDDACTFGGLSMRVNASAQRGDLSLCINYRLSISEAEKYDVNFNCL